MVDKILFCPRINFLNSQTSLLDDVETRVLLSDLAQQIRHKNADVPGIYCTFFDDASTSSTLVLNQNAKMKEREN